MSSGGRESGIDLEKIVGDSSGDRLTLNEKKRSTIDLIAGEQPGHRLLDVVPGRPPETLARSGRIDGEVTDQRLLRARILNLLTPAPFSLVGAVVANALVPETHVDETQAAVRPREIDAKMPTLTIGLVNFSLYIAYHGTLFALLPLFVDAETSASETGHRDVGAVDGDHGARGDGQVRTRILSRATTASRTTTGTNRTPATTKGDQ